MPVFRREPELPNAIVGAARRVHIDRRDEVERLRERSTAAWQRLAWRHYDAIGAVKYGYNYFSAVASRVRLYAGYQDEASDAPAPIGQIGGVSRSLVSAARHELRKLGKGRGGQPNLIRSLVLNLLVPGEGYLVGVNNNWEVRSTSELRFESDDRIRLVLSRHDTRSMNTFLPKDAFVARIWRTHPEYSEDADSSLKGVQDDCTELLLLSRLIRASARSRLNAGLLYVADELKFQRSSDAPQTTPQPNIDPLEEELTLALTEPIGESDSPSEVVPMLVRGPYQFKDGIVSVDLSRTFDKTVIQRHEQVFNYVLNGLDLPKDIVTGYQNVRYTNAREITTDMYRAHVEPMILLICEALTTIFLRPRLESRGYASDEIERCHVWYDPSGVLVKPDRSEDADNGYTKLLVSGETWRRAHGFGPSDAPTDEELARRIALGGSIAPSTTFDFLRLIAPELVNKAEQLSRASMDASGSSNGSPTEETITPARFTPPTVPTQPNLDGRSINEDSPNGQLPPEAQRDTAKDVLEVLNALRSFSNGNGTREHVDHTANDRTRKLERALEVERRLRESLLTYLNEATYRALERAGARTVSKVRNDPHLKALVVDVPMAEVFSRVPADRRRTLGLDEEVLVKDTIERAHDTYVDVVTRSQRQGWKTLGGRVAQILEPNQRRNVERSWEWLLPALVSRTVAKLQRPSSDAPIVNLESIRTAMTIAGGENVAESAPEVTSSGRAVLTDDALDATRWQFSGYRWIYGVGDHESFGPHLALDDTTFVDWEGHELRNETGSAGTRYYYPGDHDGCRCDVVPVPTSETRLIERVHAVAG